MPEYSQIITPRGGGLINLVLVGTLLQIIRIDFVICVQTPLNFRLG